MSFPWQLINFRLLVNGVSRLTFSFACIGLGGQFLGFVFLSPQWVSTISYYVLINGVFGVSASGVVHHFLKGVSAQAFCPNCKNAMIPSGFICSECGAQVTIPNKEKH